MPPSFLAQPDHDNDLVEDLPEEKNLIVLEQILEHAKVKVPTDSKLRR